MKDETISQAVAAAITTATARFFVRPGIVFFDCPRIRLRARWTVPAQEIRIRGLHVADATRTDVRSRCHRTESAKGVWKSPLYWLVYVATSSSGKRRSAAAAAVPADRPHRVEAAAVAAAADATRTTGRPILSASQDHQARPSQGDSGTSTMT
ncbi:hypothetical protein ABZ260_33350 [Streptosporangium sp. NPDC006013]|uniref:hypothetical protein n=1 Tax=Streptosporangium sp. NPDC006013 TaxID=3155596 RepID=UPI00339E1265